MPIIPCTRCWLPQLDDETHGEGKCDPPPVCECGHDGRYHYDLPDEGCFWSSPREEWTEGTMTFIGSRHHCKCKMFTPAAVIG